MRYPVTLMMDELEALFQQTPALMNKYESQEFGFDEAVLEWINSAISILEKSHATEVASMAAQKGRLLAVRAGVMDSSLGTFSSKPSRKTILAGSALIFNGANQVANSLYEKLTKRREEALTYIRQILMALIQAKIVPMHCVSRAEAIHRIFATMQAEPATSTATKHVLNQVQYADALRLIDETLHEWQFDPVEHSSVHLIRR